MIETTPKRPQKMSRPESKSEDSPDHVRTRPWSVPVRRSEVPEAGRRFDL
jgi:hypothetical protein